ncbi:protein-(glutamine-N5) methyltransferase, release factor-specific [Sandarakinorhabdus cyanobacteriorum]|uniref:Release factor glutamine methyltransferase n=1 Tax=Sandarakinorhabdus cyanobacteriorum TaxID=1981098 RepID=A0A255Z4D2_9SPHN|nr:peptide chain release factor N(5)-glutamine methyltransferase [Sandarakinorhabdus cyanobacteriorum]OYQ36309.1 protein-(glutamine-N5) methyltransferase, release factor-specific [Sandarakinorhabdus cyanobacteriorum]
MHAIAALNAAASRIGGDTARLDAEVLLAHLLGISRGALLLHPDRRIDVQAYDLLVERRAKGEPVAHITGSREFWSLDLKVTPDVLIPRPDSETLIDVALRLCQPAPTRILDLGTGSGALLLAALSEWPDASGLGIDASPAALAVASENAFRTGLADRARFMPGNWGQGLDQRFDLIISNPPYIAETETLSAEVRENEPASALFAGADGLDDYRRILPQLADLMQPGALALLEIGHSQGPALLDLAAQHGFSASLHPDLAGRDRCVALRVAPLQPPA